MAESFDHKSESPIVNDDTIKDALKAGLTGVHVSDDLAMKTLALCKEEILSQTGNAAKKAPNLSWLFKLGTPLAAGALVMVLFFTTPSMDKTAQSAPIPAPSASAAYDSNGAEENTPEAGSVELKYSETMVGSAAPAESPATGEGEDRLKSFTDDVTAYSVEMLFSSMNRTQNEFKPDNTKLMSDFKDIVTQYNSLQGTQFVLFESGVTRVQTLVESGVTAEMLKNMRDYHELLSGESYWMLPLKNTNGIVEGLLTVNEIDTKNNDMVISSNDFTVTLNDLSFLVSPHPAGALVGKNCELMFDQPSLENMVKALGYQAISDMTVIDINYGTDFLVMLKSNEADLSIPFVIDGSLYGLENQRVYPSDELVEIITEAMLK